MEVHRHPDPNIHHSRHLLPNDFQYPNTTEFSITLGDEKYNLQSTLYQNPPLSKYRLNYLHQLVPLLRVRDLLPGCLRQPHMEMFRLHSIVVVTPPTQSHPPLRWIHKSVKGQPPLV